jgi:hypothetical protein
MVEHWTENPGVASSILALGTSPKETTPMWGWHSLICFLLNNFTSPKIVEGPALIRLSNKVHHLLPHKTNEPIHYTGSPP